MAAPLETADQRRLERQAASHAAHCDVSGWDRAVQQATKAEKLAFPPERPRAHGLSSDGLTHSAPKGALEVGVEKLLLEHGMDGAAAVADSERAALADFEQLGQVAAVLLRCSYRESVLW